MAVQRERFVEPQRPVVPPPGPIDPRRFRDAQWARRKGELHFWQVSARKRLRTEVEHSAEAQAADIYRGHHELWQDHQAQADKWWNGLLAGDPPIVAGALIAAFADNPAPVRVHQITGPSVILVLTIPGMEVLPPKKAHVTPAGRSSSKAWTKTELNDVYADLLGAHLLATIRETWIVARCITSARIIGIRCSGGDLTETLFDVDMERAVGDWNNDRQGRHILGTAQWGLRLAGRTREVQAWASDDMRADIISIVV